jgi:hypothetical protein
MTPLKPEPHLITYPEVAIALLKNPDAWASLKASRISPNFTWGEVFTNRSQRQAMQYFKGNYAYHAFTLAAALEQVRLFFGNAPIRVSSWFRDPASNRASGGVTGSTHLTARGVDIKIAGHPPAWVQQQLNSWWPLGLGLGSAEFTHLDLRPNARFKY